MHCLLLCVTVSSWRLAVSKHCDRPCIPRAGNWFWKSYCRELLKARACCCCGSSFGFRECRAWPWPLGSTGFSLDHCGWGCKLKRQVSGLRVKVSGKPKTPRFPGSGFRFRGGMVRSSRTFVAAPCSTCIPASGTASPHQPDAELSDDCRVE